MAERVIINNAQITEIPGYDYGTEYGVQQHNYRIIQFPSGDTETPEADLVNEIASAIEGLSSKGTIQEPAPIPFELIPLTYVNPLAQGIWYETLNEDPDLAHHLKQVAYLSYLVGVEIGMEEEELEVLVSAALLHDLGKRDKDIQEVITLPRKLNEYERRQMQNHPTIGVQILWSRIDQFRIWEWPGRDIEILVESLPLIEHHHERWGGGGYPNGLVGDEIPVGSRIIAWCDWYSAGRSNRPDNSPEEIFKAFKKARGQIVQGVLDPQLLNPFHNVLVRGVTDETRSRYF